MLSAALALAMLAALPQPSAAQGYTDAFLTSINYNTTFPCGGSAPDPTTQVQNALQTAAHYNGGVTDLTCYQQAITLTADIFSPITKNILLYLPEHVITINANTTIPSNFMICAPPGGSIAAGVGFTLTDNSTHCFNSGGSSNVYVNGLAVSNPNFNDTDPSASSAGYQNVLWQVDGSNVSAQELLQLGNGINYLDCSTFSGSDFSVKTNNCVAALPSTGGTADTQGMSGAQNMSVNVTASTPSKPVTILLAAGLTLTRASCVGFLLGQNGSLIGQGKFSTVITGDDTCPAVGNVYANGIQGMNIQGVQIVNTGTGPCIDFLDPTGGNSGSDFATIHDNSFKCATGVLTSGYWNRIWNNLYQSNGVVVWAETCWTPRHRAGDRPTATIFGITSTASAGRPPEILSATATAIKLPEYRIMKAPDSQPSTPPTPRNLTSGATLKTSIATAVRHGRQTPSTGAARLFMMEPIAKSL